MRNSTYGTASHATSAAFALAAGLAVCQGAMAADGDLDPTFGTGGFVLTGLTAANFELPPKPIVQPDGKIVICSRIATSGASGDDFFVARFDPDGTPDTDFDFDGKVTIDFDSRDEGCNALALQPDGKIIAIGSSTESGGSSDFAVARMMPDGSLDPTLGAGTGKVIVPFDTGGSNGDVAGTVALQPDDKILVAGWAEAATGTDMAIVRLMQDGSRDTTFNATGRVTIDFDIPGSGSVDQADSLVIDESGRILVGGIAEATSNAFDFALARLLPNGQLDQGFDADGRATIAFDLGVTDSDVSYQTIRQRDGKLVMVGSADTGSGTENPDVAIARLLPDGSLDPDFGIGGEVVVPFDLVTNGNDTATGVVEDSAGRLVVAGGAIDSAANEASAVALRLLPDGTLDGSFGNFGKKIYDFGGSFALFTGVALQGTQIVGAGFVRSGSGPGAVSDDFVARIQVDLIFADGFE
jgi:uncharacterized delta-60 repeat protein